MNFTESYRHAERKHTVLLPAVMGLVVLVSFWLVTISRPTATRIDQFPSINSKGEVTSGEIGLSAPPKIDLDFDFDTELGNIPIIDPQIKVDSIPEARPAVPVAKVVKARPVSKDGLPLIRAENSEGRFTSWMTPAELNQHILSLNRGQEVSFWDRGHWIIAVEGRLSGSHQEYRIVYEKVPKNSNFQWRYRIAQSRESFRRNMDQLDREGFSLVHSQAFEKPDRSLQYQAVWQKVE